MRKLCWGKIRSAVAFFSMCLCILAFTGTTEADMSGYTPEITGLIDGYVYTPCTFPDFSTITGKVNTAPYLSDFYTPVVFWVDGLVAYNAYVWPSGSFNDPNFIPLTDMPESWLSVLVSAGTHTLTMNFSEESETEGPLDSVTYTILESCAEQVSIGIKPGTCTNLLNVKSKGVLPVAIFGTDELDVNDIDIASIRLLVDITDIAPVRSTLEDIGSPNDCESLQPDGFDDLILRFKTQEIVAALDDVEDGEVLVLTLTGKLMEGFGGTPIEGEDVVVILKKGKK